MTVYITKSATFGRGLREVLKMIDEIIDDRSEWLVVVMDNVIQAYSYGVL